MKPVEFVDHLWQERATAILRTDDQEMAARAMDAAVRGGIRIVEFTMAVPGVYELIEEFAAREGLVVGAGTVLTPGQARRAVTAGARFIVSPVVDEEVIRVAREMEVAAMPGTQTPTEMVRAHRAGAQLQKLFPAPAGGPRWVRSCLGPLPFLRIVPTNGVDEENVGDWIEAGVWGVGLVGPLFDDEDLRRGRWDAVEERARRMLAAARAAERPERGRPQDPFAG